MPFDNLLVDRDGAVAIVTINRPRVLNALNTQTLDELRRVVLDLKQDDGVRAIIVTGAGDKAFVAGADINELTVLSPTAGREHALAGQHVFDLIENLGKPVIAAINGYALGGGCELAMACTLRLAADTAKLGQPEINLGLIPGYAGTQRLARLVGTGKAMEIILTGTPIAAGRSRAHRARQSRRSGGRPHERGQEARRAPVDPGAGRGPLHHRGHQQGRRDGVRRERGVRSHTLRPRGVDRGLREGTRAFLEKRKAEFKGR